MTQKINTDSTFSFYWEVVKKSFSNFGEDDIMTHAAALAYYTIISLPPTLLVILFITTLFYDEDYIKAILFEQIGNNFGEEGANQLLAAIEKMNVFQPTLFAKIMGTGVLVFTSTTLFLTIQKALNKIFKVKSKPAGWAILYLIKDRILSFSLLVGVSFILLVSLVINAVVERFGAHLEEWIGFSSVILSIVTSVVIPLFVNVLLFAMIFKFLPDAKLAWRNTWFGAILTSILFVAGKYLISYYLGTTNVSDLYDAAGSIILMMVWVSYASAIILYGAVLTYTYIQLKGERIKPIDYAVKVVTIEKELPQK